MCISSYDSIQVGDSKMQLWSRKELKHKPVLFRATTCIDASGLLRTKSLHHFGRGFQARRVLV